MMRLRDEDDTALLVISEYLCTKNGVDEARVCGDNRARNPFSSQPPLPGKKKNDWNRNYPPPPPLHAPLHCVFLYQWDCPICRRRERRPALVTTVSSTPPQKSAGEIGGTPTTSEASGIQGTEPLEVEEGSDVGRSKKKNDGVTVSGPKGLKRPSSSVQVCMYTLFLQGVRSDASETVIYSRVLRINADGITSHRS